MHDESPVTFIISQINVLGMNIPKDFFFISIVQICIIFCAELG